MKRIIFMFIIISLAIVVSACSGDDVENANELEGSDKTQEEKEMQDESGDSADAASSDSDSGTDSNNTEGEDSNSASGNEDVESEGADGADGSSGSNSGSGETGSSDASGSSEGSNDSGNEIEGQSSGDSEGSAGSEGNNGSNGSNGDSGEAPSEDGHVNGTPRSEEEMSEATQHPFSEVNGQAVEVLMGFTAVEINVDDIPDATKDSEVYMMVDDGQIIDLSYNEEREAFRNDQIKEVSKQTLQSATVFVRG